MPQLLVADQKGHIFEHPRLKAAGMKGCRIFPLATEDLIAMPEGSRLFMLPHRRAIGIDPDTGKAAPAEKGVFAVGAFIAPGNAVTHSSAYGEEGKSPMLPLFSYAAAAFYRDAFHVAAITVDKDVRHDCRLIDLRVVRKNITAFRKAFGRNRLIAHLGRCAMDYGCPNAQNFFLSRFEAPLPASPKCNAVCAGCISYQPTGTCPASQPRISFTPTAEELAGVALYHIDKTPDAIVSFGQGCEGEPLLRARLIEETVRAIRRATPKGTIHMNTNGSLPEALERIFDAGLDSVRVSMNSCREKFYTKYYRPAGYAFADVLRSIGLAKAKRRFVSVNYLTMPGFTDLKVEFDALKSLVSSTGIDMIQWRNLNYDPVRYFKVLGLEPEASSMVGIREEIGMLRKEFPSIRIGYFNPALPHRTTPWQKPQH